MKVRISVLIGEDTEDRIGRLLERLREEEPYRDWNKSMVIRLLLGAGLESVESNDTTKAEPTPV